MSGLAFGMGEKPDILIMGWWTHLGEIYKPYIQLPIEKHVLELCPHCEIELKTHIYVKRDIITKEKVYRCSVCFTELVLENGKWKAKKP